MSELSTAIQKIARADPEIRRLLGNAPARSDLNGGRSTAPPPSGGSSTSPWVETSRTTNTYTLPVSEGATEIDIDEALTITFLDAGGNEITLQFAEYVPPE